jgi:hypothetical protein
MSASWNSVLRPARSLAFPPPPAAHLRLLRRVARRKALLRCLVDSLVVGSRPLRISFLFGLARTTVRVPAIARRLFSFDVAITTAASAALAIAVIGFIHESFHLAITP